MPDQKTAGAKMIGSEVDGELLDAFRAWARGRGETVRHALELAMRRHMAYPPSPPAPPAVEPIPDGPPAGKRPRK